MIELTTISGDKFIFNSDMIYKVESKPDTIITLINGKTLRVEENCQEIIESIIRFKKKIYSGHLEEM